MYCVYIAIIIRLCIEYIVLYCILCRALTVKYTQSCVLDIGCMKLCIGYWVYEVVYWILGI